MSVSLKQNLPFMNLPRVGNPLGVQGKNDYEQVGYGRRRTAGDAAATALNNGIAAIEDIGKAVASPFIGLGVGVSTAITGQELPLGPGGSNKKLGLGGRAVTLGLAVGVGLVGAPAYLGQAVADLGQAGLALGDAAVKAAQGKL